MTRRRWTYIDEDGFERIRPAITWPLMMIAGVAAWAAIIWAVRGWIELLS